MTWISQRMRDEGLMILCRLESLGLRTSYRVDRMLEAGLLLMVSLVGNIILVLDYRYIHFVRGHFRPVLTKEAEKVISSYYQLQRRSATQNAARTTIRMLESLIRLAQAHARLMFRHEVTRLDAISAIICVESSMMTSAILDNVGNVLHSCFTDNPDKEYAKQEKLILEKLNLVNNASDNQNGAGGIQDNVQASNCERVNNNEPVNETHGWDSIPSLRPCSNADAPRSLRRGGQTQG